MREINLRLQRMAEEAFAVWSERQTLDYAHDKVRAGNWPAEGAVERARREMASLLPQGTRTPHHFIYEVHRASALAVVGYIWLHYDPNAKDRSAFVYELSVAESERGRGLGEQILLAGEAKVKDMGAQSIKLHVFGFNDAAQKLYLKLGYQITNINMAKSL